ncbi:MAG: alpha/beta fold hydrolase [Candidatus Aminicenantes bacterium]|nr:alpha/beta fold hydrolase [Candidatus Aminicenantes bacterium]
MKLLASKIALLLIFFIFLSLIFLLIPDKILGFEDHFDGIQLDDSKWQYYGNGGYINVSDSFVSLSSNAATFPYIYAKQNPFPETGDFFVNIKIQYSLLTLRGGGIVIGNLTPPNNISVSYFDSHGKEIILFLISQDSFNHLRVVFVPCRNDEECEDEISVIQLGENNKALNEFQIFYSESRYKLLFNESLVFTSNETPRRPTSIYIGNPTNHGHSYTWSSFSVDSLEVHPSVTSLINPVILLPGLGASWNHEDIILGIHKEPEDWYMTPFVKNYDGLIQTLKNSGYEEAGPNRNLFIFNYDWRQPIETTANQLRDYIENTVNLSPEVNIDLIGHSLGGMVARAYVQNNPDHRVDQLITIGSPHKGAPKVYYLWEGADLKRVLEPWQRIGAGILLHLNKKDYQNNVETIRAVVPVLGNLLPTFPYLKYGESKKPLSEMIQRNNWLESLNQLPLPGFLTSVLNTILGVKESSTLCWINIIDRNQFDRFLDKWEDGKPIGEEFNNGDETVLVESAQLEGAHVIELSGLNHGDLVETTVGQEVIVDLLELSPSDIISAPGVIYEPSLVFQLASFANLTIIDPDGIEVATGKKLVFIPNPKKGNYQVWVNSENSGGPYRLLVGKINEEGDSWTKFSGEVSVEPKNHFVAFTDDPKQIKLELLNLARQKLLTVKKSATQLPRPIKTLLTKAIERRIGQVDKIIALFEKDKEDHIKIKTRQTILSLLTLEKNLKAWGRIFGLQPEVESNLREARDYLLQAYEFEL